LAASFIPKRRSNLVGATDAPLPRAHQFRPHLHGLKETEASIANKISRGTFSATFLLASLIAIEADTVSLEDI
jgi:hypothetical protein